MKNIAMVFVCMAAAVFSADASAETLYKVVGADGRITYTDRPPADGKATTALRFADAPSTALPDSVLKYQAELKAGMKNRLADTQTDSGTTLFSATWCGYCTRARAYLQAKGVAFREIDIDTPDGAKAFFAAGGGRGVPLLLADGKRLQGFSESTYANFFAAKK